MAGLIRRCLAFSVKLTQMVSGLTQPYIKFVASPVKNVVTCLDDERPALPNLSEVDVLVRHLVAQGVPRVINLNDTPHTWKVGKGVGKDVVDVVHARGPLVAPWYG